MNLGWLLSCCNLPLVFAITSGDGERIITGGVAGEPKIGGGAVVKEAQPGVGACETIITDWPSICCICCMGASMNGDIGVA